jgi:hypothetical protein
MSNRRKHSLAGVKDITAKRRGHTGRSEGLHVQGTKVFVQPYSNRCHSRYYYFQESDQRHKTATHQGLNDHETKAGHGFGQGVLHLLGNLSLGLQKHQNP